MFRSAAKHRCSCFSTESSSFLYGLRREAPSTERVLLERLLNVLSRAAVNKTSSGNPQRLWSETEKPDWWDAVCRHKWKNPREHPKDNKPVLKEKIEILEKELPPRNLMTPELNNELELHKNSKKVDLELKSDFEAVIAKASGLHFMLDKVANKMGQSKVISEKIATYIKETKLCLDRCHKTITSMHDKVEQGEKRRSSLWAHMGVSKQHQTSPSNLLTDDDLETDCLELDLEADTLDEVQKDAPATVTGLQESSIYLSDSDILDIINQHDVRYDPVYHRPLTPQAHGDLAPDQKLKSVQYQRSVSQPPPQLVQETVHVMDLSQGKRVAVADIEASPQPLRRHLIVGDGDNNEMTGRSRLESELTNPIIIDDDGDDHVDSFRHQSDRTTRFRSIETDLNTHKMPRVEQSGESHAYERSKSSGGYKRVAADLQSTSEKKSRKSQMLTSTSHGTSHYKQYDPLERSWSSRPATRISAALSPEASSSLSADDLVEDGDMAVMSVRPQDIEDVEDILEESTGSPTVTMYTGPDDCTAMDQLAYMTKTLSCDDLRASVMAECVQGLAASNQRHLPNPHLQLRLQHHLYLASDDSYRIAQSPGSSPRPATSTVPVQVERLQRILPRGPMLSAPLLSGPRVREDRGQEQSGSQVFSPGSGSPSGAVVVFQAAHRAPENSVRAERSLSQAIADFGGQLGPH